MRFIFSAAVVLVSTGRSTAESGCAQLVHDGETACNADQNCEWEVSAWRRVLYTGDR